MKATVATLTSLVALVALAADASAQPGAPAAPPPAPPEVVVVAPDRGPQYDERWGLGLHLGGMALAPSDEPDADEMALGGGGVQVRLRVSRRWSLQLDAGGYRTDTEDEVSLERELHLATLSARLHLRPGKKWDVYLLGGVGAAHEMVTFEDRMKRSGAMSEVELVHGVAHLGAGVEWRVGSFGLGAELRGMAMVRSDEEADGPRFVGSDYPVPAETVGAQLTLGATYYF